LPLARWAKKVWQLKINRSIEIMILENICYL
jgi:hypothetical protein